MLENIKAAIPWWGKIGIKIVLARLPLAYDFWQRLGLFRHGHMDSAVYALGVFESHMDRASLRGQLQGKFLLEMGPGDSIATAIIAYAFGARAILVDAGPFARADARPYFDLCELLRERGLNPPDLPVSADWHDVLAACGGEYLTNGLASWRTLPSDSVDFVFSHAVLEHVRSHEFLATMQECWRVLRPGGVASHRVDLRDHLGGALNNLRFSDRIWESEFFVRSGFYTNRIQYHQMLALFEEAGWAVETTDVSRWSELPTPRAKLAMQYQSLTEEELRVSGFDVLLRKGG